MNTATFTSAELCQAAGIREYDLKNWLRDERFQTDIQPTRSGRARRFSRANVYEAAILGIFSRRGLRFEEAKWFVDYLTQWMAREIGSNDFGELQHFVYRRDTPEIVVYGGTYQNPRFFQEASTLADVFDGVREHQVIVMYLKHLVGQIEYDLDDESDGSWTDNA